MPSSQKLGAFAVHDARTALIVLLLLDPHLLEGAERGQNGAANPHRVLTLGWCNDLDRHRIGRQRLHLLLHTLGNALVHRRAAAHHNVAVQVLTDVDIALHDRREGEFVDALLLETHKLRLKQRLGCAEGHPQTKDANIRREKAEEEFTELTLKSRTLEIDNDKYG